MVQRGSRSLDAVTALAGPAADQAGAAPGGSVPRDRRTASESPEEAPLADWNYTGLLFESMALRDVRVYLDATGGRTYATATAMAWKSTSSWNSTTAAGEPSFLAVLTGANIYASRRQDGIDVIPITALGRRRPPQSRATTAKLVTCT